MFEGVAALVLDEENDNVVVGLRAVNGEELRFGRMVNAAKKGLRGHAAKWLLKVEYQMRFSLSVQLEESFTAYRNLVDSDAYFEWIGDFNTQILLITKRCLWCKTIDFFLKKKRQRALRGTSGLEEALKEIKAEIALLSGFIHRLITLSVDHDENDDIADTVTLKSKVGALIQLLVSQRDVTTLLIKHRVSGPDDSMWIGRLRTYYQTDDTMLDDVNIFKKLELKCHGKSYRYGWEFYGDISSFITQKTITSDALFPHLLRSTVDAHRISNVFGAESTAKVEVVQTFAYDLGRPCKRFRDSNVDSTMRARKRVFNWFSGMSSCGAFGILEEAEMRQFGPDLLSYSMSIHRHLKEGHKQFVNGQGLSIGLHENMRMFLCSKAEKHSEYKMVESLSMPPSNTGSIAMTLLSTLGYLTAETVAPKIARLLELCGSLLSSDGEFGHEVITKMAAAAGEKLVAFVLNEEENEEQKEDDLLELDDDEALNAALSASTRKRIDGVEEGLVVKALAETMYPALTTSDRVLFESLMESAFPQNKVDWHGLSAKEQPPRRTDTEFEAELRHLRAMGFGDLRKCQSVLRKYNGDAEKALQELFESIL